MGDRENVPGPSGNNSELGRTQWLELVKEAEAKGIGIEEFRNFVNSLGKGKTTSLASQPSVNAAESTSEPQTASDPGCSSIQEKVLGASPDSLTKPGPSNDIASGTSTSSRNQNEESVNDTDCSVEYCQCRDGSCEMEGIRKNLKHSKKKKKRRKSCVPDDCEPPPIPTMPSCEVRLCRLAPEEIQAYCRKGESISSTIASPEVIPEENENTIWRRQGRRPKVLSPPHDDNGPCLSPSKRFRKFSPQKSSTEKDAKENRPPAAKRSLPSPKAVLTEAVPEGERLSDTYENRSRGDPGERKRSVDTKPVVQDKVLEKKESCDGVALPTLVEIPVVPEALVPVPEKKSKGPNEKGFPGTSRAVNKSCSVKSSRPGPKSKKRTMAVIDDSESGKDSNSDYSQKEESKHRKLENIPEKTSREEIRTHQVDKNGDTKSKPSTSSVTKDKVSREQKNVDGHSRSSSHEGKNHKSSREDKTDSARKGDDGKKPDSDSNREEETASSSASSSARSSARSKLGEDSSSKSSGTKKRSHSIKDSHAKKDKDKSASNFVEFSLTKILPQRTVKRTDSKRPKTVDSSMISKPLPSDMKFKRKSVSDKKESCDLSRLKASSPFCGIEEKTSHFLDRPGSSSQHDTRPNTRTFVRNDDAVPSVRNEVNKQENDESQTNANSQVEHAQKESRVDVEKEVLSVSSSPCSSSSRKKVLSVSSFPCSSSSSKSYAAKAAKPEKSDLLERVEEVQKTVKPIVERSLPTPSNVPNTSDEDTNAKIKAIYAQIRRKDPSSSELRSSSSSNSGFKMPAPVAPRKSPLSQGSLSSTLEDPWVSQCAAPSYYIQDRVETVDEILDFEEDTTDDDAISLYPAESLFGAVNETFDRKVRESPPVESDDDDDSKSAASCGSSFSEKLTELDRELEQIEVPVEDPSPESDSDDQPDALEKEDEDLVESGPGEVQRRRASGEFVEEEETETLQSEERAPEATQRTENETERVRSVDGSERSARSLERVSEQSEQLMSKLKRKRHDHSLEVQNAERPHKRLRTLSTAQAPGRSRLARARDAQAPGPVNDGNELISARKLKSRPSGRLLQPNLTNTPCEDNHSDRAIVTNAKNSGVVSRAILPHGPVVDTGNKIDAKQVPSYFRGSSQEPPLRQTVVNYVMVSESRSRAIQSGNFCQPSTSTASGASQDANQPLLPVVRGPTRQMQQIMVNSSLSKIGMDLEKHPILHAFCPNYLQNGESSSKCFCKDKLHEVPCVRRDSSPEAVFDLVIHSTKFQYWFNKKFRDYSNFFHRCTDDGAFDYLRKMAKILWDIDYFDSPELWVDILQHILRRPIRKKAFISDAVSETLEYILSDVNYPDENVEMKFCQLYQLLTTQWTVVPQWPFVVAYANKFPLPLKILEGVINDASKRSGHICSDLFNWLMESSKCIQLAGVSPNVIHAFVERLRFLKLRGQGDALQHRFDTLQRQNLEQQVAQVPIHIRLQSLAEPEPQSPAPWAASSGNHPPVAPVLPRIQNRPNGEEGSAFSYDHDRRINEDDSFDPDSPTSAGALWPRTPSCAGSEDPEESLASVTPLKLSKAAKSPEKNKIKTNANKGIGIHAAIVRQKFGLLSAEILRIRDFSKFNISYHIYQGILDSPDQFKAVKGIVQGLKAKTMRSGCPMLQHPNIREVILQWLSTTMVDVAYSNPELAFEIYCFAQREHFDIVTGRQVGGLAEGVLRLFVLELFVRFNIEGAARYFIDNIRNFEEMDVTTTENFAKLTSNILREYSLVDSSIDLLRRLWAESSQKSPESTLPKLWNELKGYFNLLILMLLKRHDNEKAFQLYCWAKENEILLKNNTVRVLMITLTDRKARSTLIDNEEEYSVLTKPDRSWKIWTFRFKEYWTENELEFILNHLLVKMSDYSAGLCVSALTEPMPVPDKEEAEYSPSWDLRCDFVGRVISVLKQSFNLPLHQVIPSDGSVTIERRQIEMWLDAYRGSSRRKNTPAVSPQLLQRNRIQHGPTPATSRSRNRCRSAEGAAQSGTSPPTVFQSHEFMFPPRGSQPHAINRTSAPTVTYGPQRAISSAFPQPLAGRSSSAWPPSQTSETVCPSVVKPSFSHSRGSSVLQCAANTSNSTPDSRQLPPTRPSDYFQPESNLSAPVNSDFSQPLNIPSNTFKGSHVFGRISPDYRNSRVAGSGNQLENSFAPRENSFAPRENSFASRENSFASRENSFASRENSFASRENSFASRENSFASRENSFAPQFTRRAEHGQPANVVQSVSGYAYDCDNSRVSNRELNDGRRMERGNLPGSGWVRDDDSGLNVYLDEDEYRPVSQMCRGRTSRGRGR